ncbi:MAG: phospholipid carrier-dependent glycosyltransferase [Patescibacteria group bacterium]
MATIVTKKILIFLVLIIFVGLLLRLYKLDQLPLYGDEVDIGYNAYSILKTTRDVTGHFLPIYLTTFIDIKSSLLAYFSTVPIHFLGLNEISIRLIPALSGVMIVVLIFLIVMELFKNKTIALMASFLAAVSPWAIHFSRGAFEANLMLFLLLLGIYLFLKSFGNYNLLFFSSLSFSLSLYAYHAAKVLVPLMILGLIIFFGNFLKGIGRRIIFVSLVFLIFSLPIFYASIFSRGQERFSEVSVFSDQKIIEQIILKRQDDSQSSLSSRFFHNKAEGFLNKIFANYLESFSPQFLFLYGDPNFRHSSGGGEVYALYLPFLLIGLFFLFKERQNYQKFFLYWLLIAAMPAAITKDGGQHAIRLLFLMPVILIISAFGFYNFIFWVNRVFNRKSIFLLYFALIAVFIFSFITYLHQYFIHYPKESWRFWAYGYKEAMLSTKELEKDYDYIWINNSYEPSILWFLFWNKYEPKQIHKLDIKKGIKFVRLGKYYFYKPSEKDWKYGGVQGVLKNNRNTLVLASAKDDTAGDKDLRDFPLKGTRLLKTITNPYNQPIFYLLTNE